MAKFDPNKDGVDHINVYSQGRTELGRLLSNFAYTPFICEDGRFQSIEGYWYWLLSIAPERDRLRNLHGFMAKKAGRELRAPDMPEDRDRVFREKIYNALKAKLEATRGLKEMLQQSHLPFRHYYVYNAKIVTVPECDWLLVYWENLRTDLQNEETT